MTEKNLPLGDSDFCRVITDNKYFIDKSMFIKDVVEGATVQLYPRPRRFGKTLNLSMLRYFYNKNGDNSSLFKDLLIAKEEKIMQKQGKHPVVFLTLKDVKYDTFERCMEDIYGVIIGAFKEHKQILQSDCVDELEINYFTKILTKTATFTDYANSLKYLSEYLSKFHKINPVILIDEYDTPIQAAYHYGYYEDLIIFMRNFLSGALKDNVFLEKAVLTGILRVSKESLFSGLNNILVCSILENESADKFGFTEAEVEKLVADFNNCVSVSEIKNWYDGYNFAGHEIYNPWSIIHCIYRKKLSNYWANTSDNGLIKELCQKSPETVKNDLEILIEYGSIKKPINDNIIFAEIENEDVLWSFMLMCGYLRYDNLAEDEDDLTITADLSIPNKEIMSIFVRDVIKNWFKRPESTTELEHLANELACGDLENFKKAFIDFCTSSFSYHDVGGNEPEKFYHGFVLGLLVCLKDKYRITSNREAGLGRYDLMLEPNDKSMRGIIFEFKTVDTAQRQTFASVIEKAKKQIIEKKYTQELHTRGVKEVVHIIAVFKGKEVIIESFI
jgi:hypothetical protein